MKETRNAYSVLVGKPKGKKPLRKPRRRWEHDIEMNVKEIGSEGVHWIRVAQDRDVWRAFVNMVMNIRV
jgi:hypothetical protein